MNVQASVRLVVYVLGAVAGLAAAVLGALGIVEYNALLTAIAGLAAAVTGGVASYNIEKGTNHEASVREILDALLNVSREAKGLGAGKPEESYVGRHRADSDLPVY